MRKKLLFITAAAGLLALAACNREEVPASAPEALPSLEKASLTVRLEGSSLTKAGSQSAEEAKVNTLQVFVFNADNIDVYGKVSDASTLTLDATVGERTVWALVNAPDLGSVTSMAALKAAVSSFSDNAAAEDSAAAKVTRLILECSVGGTLYTYPVLLGAVGSNRSYEIKELVITRLGNPSDGDDDIDSGEDQPVTSVDIPFGVSVSDWEVVLLGDNGTVSI